MVAERVLRNIHIRKVQAKEGKMLSKQKGILKVGGQEEITLWRESVRRESTNQRLSWQWGRH